MILPLPADVTPPLLNKPVIKFPWQTSWDVPGIHLSAPLAGASTIGVKLRLHDATFRLYCPTTKDWAAANPTYAPMAAASAMLDIPSADVSLDLTALGVLSPDHMTLIGMFQSVTLNKLENLIDAAGGSDLTGFLPQDVAAGMASTTDMASTTGKLALEAITVDIGAGFKINSLGLAIGIPNLHTNVLPGFTVNSLVANFTITNPFGGGRGVSLTMGGNVTVVDAPFDIYIDLPEISATAELSAPTAVNLSKVAAQVGLPAPADVSNLTIDTMELYADHSGSLTFSTAMAQKPPWILNLGTTPVTVTDVSATLSRAAGQKASAQFSGAFTLGGFSLGLSASSAGGNAGWLLGASGAQPDGSSIPVGDFLHALAAALDLTMPDALIEAVKTLRMIDVTLTIDTPTKTFSFNGDINATGHIPLGLATYDVDLHVHVDSVVDPQTKQRTSSGHLEADLAIGNAVFMTMFDFGTVKSVTGSWRSADGSALDVRDVAKAIGINDPIAVPNDLDLGLKSASFVCNAAPQSFTLSGETTLFGDAFMTMEKGTDGRWGVVLGVDTPKPGRLSDLPVIGSQLHAADFLAFEQMGLLIASNTFPNFTIPPLPALPPPADPLSLTIPGHSVIGRPIQPIASGNVLQLAAGLSLAATLDLAKGSTDKRLANLCSIVGQPQLTLQATFGPSALSLFTELADKIFIPAGKGRLGLSNPMIRIDAAPLIDFQISGGMAFTIQNTPIAAAARLILSETEAEVAISVAAGQAVLPAPPGVRGLHIEQFGIAMGVFFEPPGLDLGLQGKFRIGEDKADRPDEFAYVLEMVGEVANIRYLSFYVDKLDLGQVVTLFTDRTEPATVSALEIVKVSDLSFHWSETEVALPHGSVAAPGFGFSGSVQILSFGAHAELEVSIAQGVFGKAEMSPIDLRGILQISGDGAGMERVYQHISNQWTEVTNNAVVRQLPPPPTQKQAIVAPGGPVIEFNALKSPFVHVDWRVSLFDVVKEKVDVTIGTNGFSFILTHQVGSIAKFDMHCSLGDAGHFAASADLAIHLDARIGPIHVKGTNIGTLHLVTDVNCSLGITLDASRFALAISGGFNFEGLPLTVPTINTNVAPKSIADLPPLVLRQINNFADNIFLPIVGNVEKWSEMIGKGTITGVTDVAATLKTAFAVTAPTQATQLMNKAGQDNQTIVNGLKSAYGLVDPQAISQAFKGLPHPVDQTIAGHIDVATVPHGDARTPHGDGAKVPHGDSRSAHGDSGAHTDTHAPIVGHVDAGKHVDVPGIHGDTPAVHLDAPAVHTDTPKVHVDASSTHVDTR